MLGLLERAMYADAAARDPRQRGDGGRAALPVDYGDRARGTRNAMCHVKADDVAVVAPVQRRAHVRLPVLAASERWLALTVSCIAADSSSPRLPGTQAPIGGLRGLRLGRGASCTFPKSSPFPHVFLITG